MAGVLRRALARSPRLPPPRPGRAALVTGASAGIGRAFASELARAGYDVVAVARREARLERLAGELRAHGVRAEALACDLRDLDAVARLPQLASERGLEPQIVVNNAGFGAWGRFVDVDLARQLEQVRVHDEATLVLTRAALPAMIERREGAILNVASSAGLVPVPYLAVYSASKAFLCAFGEALGEELRGSGVAVLVVNPGAVPTEFGAVSGVLAENEPGPMVTPELVAAEALRAARRGRAALVPGRAARLSVRMGVATPRRLRLALLERAYRPPGDAAGGGGRARRRAP